MSAPLKPSAPRGKQYAVARFTHVTADAGLVIERARHDTLADVCRQAAQFDARLQPTVVVVDKQVAA